MPDPGRTVDMISERMAAGTLPSSRPDEVWVGYGQNLPCHACDQPILPAQVEHELDFPDCATVRLHAGCAALYEAVRRRAPAPPG